MTPDLPPSPIAYAIPEHDRVDGRVRRVVAYAAIALGAVGVGTGLLLLSMMFGLVPSSIFGAGGMRGGQPALQGASAILDLSILVGGALLLRADLPAARWLIRIGCGARAAIVLFAVMSSMIIAAYPASFTIGDRAYMILANTLGHLIVPAALFLLTFALPPLRAR